MFDFVEKFGERQWARCSFILFFLALVVNMRQAVSKHGYLVIFKYLVYINVDCSQTLWIDG